MDHQPQKDQNSGQASTSPAAISAAETDKQTPAADKLAKKKSSSSSSSSGNIDEEDDFFQIEGPILGSTISFGHNAPSIAEQSGAGSGSSPKQSPPGVQAMSRASPADERVIVPDPKRIPSSVFARSRSTSPPTDWSVTSNESLFSINVGNASFSRDHFFLYGKSGDMMGNPNDPLAPLPPLPRPSTSSAMSLARSGDQDGGAKTTTAVQAGAKLKPAAAVAAKEGDDRDDGDGNADYNHSLSHRSDASTTSFAFPMYDLSARSTLARNIYYIYNFLIVPGVSSRHHN